jgi:hypothetical protein
LVSIVAAVVVQAILLAIVPHTGNWFVVVIGLVGLVLTVSLLPPGGWRWLRLRSSGRAAAS